MNDPMILLVEDAAADVLLTQRALRKSQIKAQLLIANNGGEAWDLIQDQKTISLILLDLHLPKIDGLHLLEKIRHDETTRPMNVVIVTSSELHSDRSKATEFGADGYIAKPIDPTKLKGIIDTLNIEALKPDAGNQDG
jgi:two-component system, response regulator